MKDKILMITKRLSKYIKYILAIIFYILCMQFLGNLIVPIVKSILKLDYFNLLAAHYHDPFSYYTFFYNQSIGTANSILQFIMYFIIFIGLIAILFKEISFDISDYKAHREDRDKSLLTSFLIYFGINLFTNFLVIILSKYLDVSVISQNQASLETMASSSLLSYFILGVTVVIIGPLVEELIFRKSMFKLIPNDILAIVISSLLFGLMHTIGYNYSIQELLVVTLPYLASGVVFGLCYKLSNHNILIVYGMHAALNLFSLFMMLY